MKTIHLRCAAARQAALVLILFFTALGLWAQTPTAPMTPAQRSLLEMRLRALTNNPAGATAEPATPVVTVPAAPSAGVPASGVPAAASAVTAAIPGAAAVLPVGAAAPETEVAGYRYDFSSVDVKQVLDVYANLVNRTLLMGVPPNGTIVLHTQSPLTMTEAKEALEAVLALNGITVIPIGEKFLKVLPPDQAASSGMEFKDVPASQLPILGSYVTHIAQMKYVLPSKMVQVLQPFARLPNALIPLDDNYILVIRDYAENVKRMLEMMAKIDVNVPAVYISEVIPIRYAQADDIANALNSLGGSGGATVSVGSAGANPQISGVAGNRGGTGFGGMGATQTGVNSPASPFGQRSGFGAQANPTGTPSSATPFQQRLLNIINRAGGPGGGGQEPIQIFGQAKIIADERSNSLLIFATRQDLDAIKHVISQLDVLLAQVLIESVIIDYSLGPDTLSFGVSAAQNQKTLSPSMPTVTAGGMNNGQSFFNFMNSATTNLFPGNLTSTLPSQNLSYFGNIGPTWDVAVQAAASDSHASIIQQPRILTQQAKAAQFFVGDTVPYVTSTYNYGGAYGNQSSYSQLSVGVELDVTPFINPDGLVVMQIQQEIDDLNGFTTITGVGQIPNTIKRTLNSEIAVRNKDTVMLGGFIKNAKSTSRSGVPLLQDIPLLGNLFSSHNNSKQREELIVLMRPTVLKTPEIAAANTIAEGRRLPGVSTSLAEDVDEQSKLVEAEQKKELKHPKTMQGGFFNTPMPTNAPSEQLAQPQVQSYDYFKPVAPAAPAVPEENNNAAPPQP